MNKSKILALIFIGLSTLFFIFQNFSSSNKINFNDEIINGIESEKEISQKILDKKIEETNERKSLIVPVTDNNLDREIASSNKNLATITTNSQDSKIIKENLKLIESTNKQLTQELNESH